MMTQELLSHALGVRREGVTVAAGKLHKQGVIEYRRGKITVLDRTKLESLSCECYAVVRKETGRLLPFMHQDERPFDWADKRLESKVDRARIRTIDGLLVA